MRISCGLGCAWTYVESSAEKLLNLFFGSDTLGVISLEYDCRSVRVPRAILWAARRACCQGTKDREHYKKKRHRQSSR